MGCCYLNNKNTFIDNNQTIEFNNSTTFNNLILDLKCKSNDRENIIENNIPYPYTIDSNSTRLNTIVSEDNQENNINQIELKKINPVFNNNNFKNLFLDQKQNKKSISISDKISSHTITNKNNNTNGRYYILS